MKPAAKQDDASNFFAIETKITYTGTFESHNFPSLAEIIIDVTPLDESVIQVAVSSSDGAGATSNATYAGDGLWLVHEPVLFGTGWVESSDPFDFLAQQRALIFSSDGSATYQDLGEDITKLVLFLGKVNNEDMASTEDPASPTNDGNVVANDGATAIGDPSGSGRKLASATTRIVSAALRMFGI